MSVAGFCARLTVAATSAEVNVWPSSNLTPLRSVKVTVLPPFETFHLVARSFEITSLLFSWTSVS